MANVHGLRREPRQEHENNHEHAHEAAQEQFQKHRKVCTVNTSEDITITTPISVSAYADSCDVELICNGHEIIRDHHCRPKTSKFKIRQKIRACIPVAFVAECDIGEGHVDFDFHDE